MVYIHSNSFERKGRHKSLGQLNNDFPSPISLHLVIPIHFGNSRTLAGYLIFSSSLGTFFIRNILYPLKFTRISIFDKDNTPRRNFINHSFARTITISTRTDYFHIALPLMQNLPSGKKIIHPILLVNPVIFRYFTLDRPNFETPTP